jgi:hypothetical protein
MNPRIEWKSAASAGLVAAFVLAGSPVEARDFFTSFFQGFTGQRQASPPPAAALPFADPNSGNTQPAPPVARVSAGGSGAYCVRTCDGRYFPLSTGSGQSKAETCKSLCPASETKVVYGSDIDSAATDSGKPYASLPNAFRYRTELVNGCTCNGKSTGGLAHINAENDPTLRKGDLVASADGSLSASRNGLANESRRSASYTPKPRRANFFGIPIVAAE